MRRHKILRAWQRRKLCAINAARREFKEVVMGWVLANAVMAFTRYADAATKAYLEAKYTRRLEKMLRQHDGERW